MLKMRARLDNIIVTIMVMIALFVISALTSSMNNLVHAAGVQATFYVSPQGDDTNSGTELEPFATIQKARDVIRTINSNMTGDIVVYIRGGKYYLSETITFNESDSGTNGYNIYYKNYTNEEPMIYGGEKITNWTLDSGNIYKAYVGTGKTFYNLIENDKRVTMARFPNSGYLTVESTISGRQYDQFKYRSGDLPSNFDYSDAQVHIWPGESGWNWFTLTDPISHVDSSSRIITLETPFSDSSWIKFDSGARYYVKGSKDFLDTAGEYYLDEDTGYLYYWPKKTPIQDQEIVAPVSQRIFEFKGNSTTNLVKNIQIEGLTLNCSDSTNLFRPYYMNGIDGNEFDEGRNGLIYMENATNNTIKFCKILNAGLSGIAMNRYAQNNTAYGNWIESPGYCGVNLVGWAPGEGGFSSAADSYVNKNNTISNNYIYDIGKMVGHASGVYLIQSGDNEISYNIITKSPRYGVSVKGVRYGVLQSSYYNTAVTWDNHWDFLHSRNNTIKFNDISNILNDSQDGGAVESWGCGTNNVLDNNRIYNVTSGIAGGLTMGLYLDDAADYWTIKNNIIHSIQGSHCYSAYIKGVGHTVTNNIIADNDSHASVYMWAMAGERNDHVTFNKNIFYNSHGSDIYKFADWTDNKITASDYNVFYHTSGSYNVIGIPGYDSWNNWRSLYNNKYDQHSSIADPLFVDRTNHNYTVQSGSPALSNGFVNINQSDIGLKSDFPWNLAQDAFSMIEAEDCSSNGTSIASGGTGEYVGSCDDNDWLSMNVDFGTGAKYFEADVACDSTYAGQTVELRLNSPQGQLIGSMTVASTGGWDTFTTQGCNITPVSGDQKLYIVFNGEHGICNIDRFKFFQEASIQLPFTDDFESETIGESASNWLTVLGTWEVISGKSYKVNNAGIATVGNDSWTDYSFESKLKVDNWNTTGYRSVGIMPRYQDINNYYYFQYYHNDGKFYISKKVNGNWTNLANYNVTFNTGQFYTFKVEVAGASIICYLDGQEIMNVTDSQFSSGKVAIQGCDNPGTFDDVNITELITYTTSTTRQAEDYNAMSGVAIQPYATAVGWCDDGDWMRYDNVQLNSAYTKFTTRCGVDNAYAGKQVEIRLDSTTGTLLGTMTMQGTGGWEVFQEQMINISSASGVHNIYVVFKGGSGVGNFDWFKFSN